MLTQQNRNYCILWPNGRVQYSLSSRLKSIDYPTVNVAIYSAKHTKPSHDEVTETGELRPQGFITYFLK